MSKPKAIVPVTSDLSHIKFMLYSEPGGGKTVLAGTSPNALLLVNDLDETVSAFIHGSKADQWHVQDYNDLTEAYEYMRHGGTDEYDWLWIDNGTLFQEQGMDQIMEELVLAKTHRDRYVPDKPEYLQNQNRLGSLIRNFKALPINFGITAHVMRDDDGNKQPMFQGGQGAFSQKLCGYMNIVGYLHASEKGGKFSNTLYTSKRNRFYAKDRFSAFGGKLDHPTIPKMEAAIAARKPEPKPRTTRRRKAA